MYNIILIQPFKLSVSCCNCLNIGNEHFESNEIINFRNSFPVTLHRALHKIVLDRARTNGCRSDHTKSTIDMYCIYAVLPVVRCVYQNIGFENISL